MDNTESSVYFADVYAKLAAPFETTFRDIRGGVDLEYITGEQCITRLNEVLGVAGWSFTIREHGLHAEADEMWVLGEIEANFGGTLVTRQQFGSQKVRRSRASGTPIDVGFDLKAAATDALKKCAMLLGVGLYLSRKEAPTSPAGGNGVSGTNGLILVGGTDSAGNSAAESGSGDTPTCAICGSALTETRFRDGSVWPPGQLAAYGRRKHNRVLCMEHYRAANEARRRGEQALEEAPF